MIGLVEWIDGIGNFFCFMGIVCSDGCIVGGLVEFLEMMVEIMFFEMIM